MASTKTQNHVPERDNRNERTQNEYRKKRNWVKND